MHVFLFLAAVWVLPALVIAGLYIYEVIRRRALSVAPAHQAAEAHAYLMAQRQLRQHSAMLATQPLAVPMHSTMGSAHEAQPARIEVPLLLHDGSGRASMECCVLCLN